jgi:cytochrome c553
VTAIVCIAGFACARPAAAEGDAERGKALAYTCFGCHGIEGYRNAYPSYRVPKLGGQSAAYIAAALKEYRDGGRSHPTMTAQASSLSDQGIEDVAAYLATLGTATVAKGGSRGVNLPAAHQCAACHGLNGIAVSPTWPTLAGQHEDYLVAALRKYRDGRRKNLIMATMAAALSDADIKALAHYFAGLEGLQTPHPD